MEQSKIATVITLVVLVVAAVWYINKNATFRSAANATGIGPVPSACSQLSDSNWSECKNFVNKVLEQSNSSDDQEINALRAKVFTISEQISRLLDTK